MKVKKAIAIITSLCFQEHIKIEEMTARWKDSSNSEKRAQIDTNNAIADYLAIGFGGYPKLTTKSCKPQSFG